MALLGRFRRNLLLKSLSDVLTRGLSFVFVMLTARLLGRESYGVFSAAQNMAFLSVILADLGIHLLVTREIAARRARGESGMAGYVGNLISLKLALSGAVFVVITLVSLTPAYRDLSLPLMLSGLFMVSWSGVEFTAAILCGFERMEYEAVQKGAGRALVIVLGMGALFAGGGLIGLIAAMAAAPVLVLGATLAFAARRGRLWRPRWDPPVVRSALGQALPLAAVNILVTRYLPIDIMLLETLRGDHHEIGIYAAAVNILAAFGAVGIIFAGGLFPVFSDLAGNRPEAFRSMGRDVIRIMALLGLPLFIAGFLLAPWIVSLLGGEYVESGTALRFLLADLPFIYINMQTANMMFAAGRQRAVVGPGVLALAANVVLNLALIPRLGYRGAAVAAVITDMLLFVLIARAGRGVLPEHFPGFLWRYAAAGALAGAAAFLLGDVSPVLALAGAAVVYTGVLLGLREFSAGDFERLRRFAGSRITGLLTGTMRPR